MKIKRNRFHYGILIFIVIVLGLSSRRYSHNFPKWVESYAGDILWALMVFLIIGFLFAKLETRTVTVLAIVFSFAIEFSQLYHEPWIDSIRKTRLGALALGFGFLRSDLICYIIGISIGMLLEKLSDRYHRNNFIK